MKHLRFLIFITAAIFFVTVSSSFARERGDMVVSGGVVFTPILYGEADTGANSPDYNDLFNSGVGVGLDGMFVVRDWFRTGASFSVLIFPGDELDGADVGKWWVAPMMIGAQLLPLTWSESSLRPYLRLDLGMVYFGAVKVDRPGSDVDYSIFKTSVTWAGDVGGGVEWNLSDTWGLFAELRYMITAHPLEAGELAIDDPTDAGFMPVRLGLTYTY